MDRISPVEFFDQVKTETVMTGVMVMIMTTLLGVFFVGIDSLFDVIVRFLLSLAQ